jgi:hypothetical protein
VCHDGELTSELQECLLCVHAELLSGAEPQLISELSAYDTVVWDLMEVSSWPSFLDGECAEGLHGSEVVIRWVVALTMQLGFQEWSGCMRASHAAQRKCMPPSIMHAAAMTTVRGFQLNAMATDQLMPNE